jgi:Protein of unknown function (DUF2721)
MIEGEAARAVPGLIQTALAPVFLLTAIGATLSVIDNRLNRIVDRARELDAQIADNPASSTHIRAEADHFVSRARSMTNAVMLCTLTALTVACVVVLIFIDLQTRVDLSLAVELVFTLAVLLYVGALALYLRDAFQVRIGLEYVQKRLSPPDEDKG